MTSNDIPIALQEWAATDAGTDEKLGQLVILYAEALDCQRCIIYCRQPDLARTTTTHAWWSTEKEEYAVEWESWLSPEWVDEVPPNAEDPLYTEALTNPSAMYIDDIRHDPTGLVNLEFEERVFKHRALIHAPIYHDGKFYGILEPSVFDEPRAWSAKDKAIRSWVQAELGPIVAKYVAEYGPK